MPARKPPTSSFIASCVLSLGLSLGLTAGCTGDGVADGLNDGFGDKADNTGDGFTSCQFSEVLNFANESNTTVSRLTRAGLSQQVATNIFNHRIGPDGTLGTGDDNLYDDLDELDAIDFVGPVVLDRLVAAILKRCEVDLATHPFVNEKTFEGFTGGGFERDAVELEAAMSVSGITGQRLQEVLTSTDSRDRTIFSRIAKVRLMEAFTYSFDINEMPWDSNSHEAREGLPFLPISIERSNYTPDEDGGVREVRVGTDVMDDIYFDTFDYRLTKNEQLLRGRIRWDTADVVRRLLIAAKFGAFVDDNGLKRASKLDVRTEGGSNKDSIENDVMRGMVDWNGSDAPLEPVKEIYGRLNDNNQLPDIGSERDVLVLDPKVHIRSTRGRFHYDLTQIGTLRSFYNNGRQRIRDIRSTAQAAVDDGRVTGQTLANVQELIAMADSLDSGQIIADRARAGLLAVDSNMDVTVGNLTFPDELSGAASTLDDLEKNKVVAEVIDEAFHEFGALVDDLDRDITGTTGLDSEEYVDMFIAWQHSIDSDLQIERTTHSVTSNWAEIDASADKADQIAAFNTFAAQQLADGDNDFEDFDNVDESVWSKLGQHLSFATTKYNQRQVESAGSMALGLWFDQARETYVPGSNRPFGNFMIDTMDMAEMLTRKEWVEMSDAERMVDVPFDPAKVFHTVLVNEVQIELSNESAYLDRINSINESVNAGTATPEDLQNLAGAEMVLGQMSDALIYLSDIKKEKLLDRLTDNGAPNTVNWTPSEDSKGTAALKRLGDMD